jgi:hypothetical protein
MGLMPNYPKIRHPLNFSTNTGRGFRWEVQNRTLVFPSNGSLENLNRVDGSNLLTMQQDLFCMNQCRNRRLSLPSG